MFVAGQDEIDISQFAAPHRSTEVMPDVRPAGDLVLLGQVLRKIKVDGEQAVRRDLIKNPLCPRTTRWLASNGRRTSSGHAIVSSIEITKPSRAGFDRIAVMSKWIPGRVTLRWGQSGQPLYSAYSLRDCLLLSRAGHA